MVADFQPQNDVRALFEPDGYPFGPVRWRAGRRRGASVDGMRTRADAPAYRIHAQQLDWPATPQS